MALARRSRYAPPIMPSTPIGPPLGGPRLTLSRDSRLLFVGDSITDAGRRQGLPEDPDGLGVGHVRLVRDWLLARDPAALPTVLNRGVGGDTVLDLEARWEADVIAERPDALSVKIGVNDVWRQIDGKSPGVPVGPFAETYRRLLGRTRDALPDCAIVLCEPSAFLSPQLARGNDLLAPYLDAIAALADEFDAAAVVRLHSAFTTARDARPDVPTTADGVHPTPAGVALIARAWLAATGLL